VDLRREGEQHGIPDAVLEQISDDLEEFEAEGVGKVELEQQTFADSVSGTRADMHGVWRVAVFVVALVLSGFHLYTAVRGLRSSLVQGSFHLALGLCLIFLLYPSKIFASPRDDVRGWALTLAGMLALVAAYATEMAGAHIVLPAAGVFVLAQAARHVPVRVWGLPVPDLVLSLAGLGAGLYVWYFSSPIERAGGFHGEGDMAVATVGILLVLLATQRVIGTPLVVVAVLALAYTYWGQSMPGFLAHGGFSVDRIVSRTFLGTEGIFGTPIRVSSTFIFIFLIFAALLQRTGMERFFTQAAFGLTGWMTGGTAKVGVLTSAFSGTITGSSVANTVSNGAFTIPMMKKSGYKGEYAGAVEAASSTGGQIAPPVMGAAAFIMIDMTGMPYAEIIKAALIPAILFFTAQYVIIHYDSKRLGIGGLPRDQLPKVGRLLLRKGYLIIPIVVIFAILLQGMTPMRAATRAIAWAIGINIAAQLIAALFRRWRDMEDKLTPLTLLEGLVDAARLALPIIVACAAAGLIAGVITLTGIGLQLAGALVALAGNQLFVTALLAMIACLILGIGVPTTANYVITATLAAPALMLVGGFEPHQILIAHMFVYYFGVMADITPPVCLAAYAASGIARSNPLRTGVQSARIALSGFVVPYMFLYSHELLLIDATWVTGTVAALSAFAGIFILGVAVVGFMHRKLNPVVRLVLAAAGLMLLHADIRVDLLGLAMAGAIFAWEWRVRRRVAVQGQAVEA
jgi:TRAP transporter 4TM/12TM fusion protein